MCACILSGSGLVAHNGDDVVTHAFCRSAGPGDGVTEYLGVSPVLSSDLFKQFIIPELLRIFQVHDSHIRLLLLRHLPRYVHLFDRDSLRTDVLPQVRLVSLCGQW